MTEDEATRPLSDALNHLHAFAARFDARDMVDEESKLSTYDLNFILLVGEQALGLREVMSNL